MVANIPMAANTSTTEKLLIVNKSVLIRAEAISLKDGNQELLRDINLSIHPGEIITLIGPNGAGKTSLVNVLLGLRAISSGKITRQPKLNIGYMPQKLQINPLLPLTVKRFFGLVKNQWDDMGYIFKRCGVEHLLGNSLQTLSGGELQRVLLARALLQKPQLLALDEPAQGVDVSGQSQLYQLIADFRDELDCAVLMVSHDLHLVMAATDHVICLNQHVCCHGRPESVGTHPAYLELFGDTANNLAAYTHRHDHQHDLDGAVVDVSEPDK
ncbi:MAG: zinc transport system ATP-binding protein [Cellvibrionaceae bacterium]|jgi:zinc transport system ATP-binding protein